MYDVWVGWEVLLGCELSESEFGIWGAEDWADLSWKGGEEHCLKVWMGICDKNVRSRGGGLDVHFWLIKCSSIICSRWNVEDVSLTASTNNVLFHKNANSDVSPFRPPLQCNSGMPKNSINQN